MIKEEELKQDERRLLLRAAKITIIFVGIALLTILLLAHNFSKPKPVLHFKLITHQKEWLSSLDLPQKPTLVFFGFTKCPGVCPTTLSTLSQALKKLENDTLPNVLFITIDPNKDTSHQLNQYLKSFHPQIIGLTGPKHELASVYQSFQVYLSQVYDSESESTYLNHSGWVYFFDKHQRFIRHVPNSLSINRFTQAIQFAFH